MDGWMSRWICYLLQPSSWLKEGAGALKRRESHLQSPGVVWREWVWYVYTHVPAFMCLTVSVHTSGHISALFKGRQFMMILLYNKREYRIFSCNIGNILLKLLIITMLVSLSQSDIADVLVTPCL